MSVKHKNEQNKIFVKKSISELNDGDILLHPIYRSDGLMLMKQYKALSSDLAFKIGQMVPGELPVIVLSPYCDLESFSDSHYYNNGMLIKELRNVRKRHGEYMQVPLELSAFADIRATINNDDVEPSDENLYLNYLYKSPFFSTFEKKLESFHLQLRAKRIKEVLINTISGNDELLDKLNMLKDYKDILLLHSINTTCVSLMIGLTLELSETDLLDLALANLLSDISITQIPKEVFDSHLQGVMSNRNFYKLHLSQLGEVSQQLSIIRKESIILGVLDQYEYYNGMGYSKGKNGSAISLFGRIISIAQAYDEMVGGYFYNNGIKPIQALHSIWERKGVKFDPYIVRIFIDRTSILKVNQQVILPNFRQGTILGFTDFINSPLSPIIEMKNGDIVDLLKIELQ